jgi:Ran GTPase-activating protein (RanGAP) involved in mRNA processing and transport
VIAQILTSLRYLNSLSLKGCSLSKDSIKILCSALDHDLGRGTAFLTKLNLSSNDLGIEGVTTISEMLKVNQRLETLILSDNGIGHEGSILISNAL